MSNGDNIFTKRYTRGIFAFSIIALCFVLVASISRLRKHMIYGDAKIEVKEPLDTLFRFDPNTVSYDELLLLGFDKRTSIDILRYRQVGRYFTIAEELALFDRITDSMFRRVRPYIYIDAKHIDSLKARRDSLLNRKPYKPAEYRFTPRPFEPFGIDTVGVSYLRLVGFSTRQAEALIRYRESGGGIFSMNELRDCYAVSEEMADSLEYFIVLSVRDPYDGLVEINSADSTSLRKVRGIGAKSVVAIMQYRKLLGGFVRKEQISELKCVTQENFELICKQIYCDSCKISKIDINFAPASDFEHHPYMTRKSVKRILEQRESKGGWRDIEEMIDDEIFIEEQAEALAPYLLFGDAPQNFD